ncbi:MAG: nucleotide exchange factor GrpE [Anaerolineales bacterium]
MSSKKTRRLENGAEPPAEAASSPEAVSVPEALPAAEELQKQIDELQARLADVEKQLAEAQAQAAEYKDGWQRALADFQNYKRRVEAEKGEAYRIAVGDIVKRYLPILDDLERALAARPADLAWAEGIELIHRKWQTLLEGEGVTRIAAEGQPFDPNIHEAVGQEAVEGAASGTVIEVVRQGYLLGERVLRPAMVRVAQ